MNVDEKTKQSAGRTIFLKGQEIRLIQEKEEKEKERKIIIIIFFIIIIIISYARERKRGYCILTPALVGCRAKRWGGWEVLPKTCCPT